MQVEKTNTKDTDAPPAQRSPTSGITRRKTVSAGRNGPVTEPSPKLNPAPPAMLAPLAKTTPRRDRKKGTLGAKKTKLYLKILWEERNKKLYQERWIVEGPAKLLAKNGEAELEGEQEAGEAVAALVRDGHLEYNATRKLDDGRTIRRGFYAFVRNVVKGKPARGETKAAEKAAPEQAPAPPAKKRLTRAQQERLDLIEAELEGVAKQRKRAEREKDHIKVAALDLRRAELLGEAKKLRGD